MILRIFVKLEAVITYTEACILVIIAVVEVLCRLPCCSGQKCNDLYHNLQLRSIELCNVWSESSHFGKTLEGIILKQKDDE